jgi:hypothetical protein
LFPDDSGAAPPQPTNAPPAEIHTARLPIARLKMVPFIIVSFMVAAGWGEECKSFYTKLKAMP